MTTPESLPKVTLPGLLTTLLAVCFIGFGFWYTWGALLAPDGEVAEDVRANERHTLENLKRILSAQEDFKARHPRGEYARFFTHLWQWVDPHRQPVHLGLIARRLAMAMGPTKAVDGYYFVDVRERWIDDREENMPIDYARQWAVAALPAAFGKTGRLVFLADQTGRIYAVAPSRPPSRYPHDPAAAGWRIVDSAADLLALQSVIGNR